jgi:hypothetical protein
MGNTPPMDAMCDEVISLVPAYAIGATDPEESHLVEMYLSECPEAVAELRQYAELAEQMLISVPPLKAPGRLSEKLLNAARNTPDNIVQPNFQPERQKSGISRKRLWTGLVAAVCGLLLASNLYWFAQVTNLENEQDDLQVILDHQRQILASIGNNVTQVTLLNSTDDAFKEALVSVFWMSQLPPSLLYATNLPPLEDDHVYQVWLMRGEDPLSVGTFSIDEQGYGTLAFDEQDMSTIDIIAITSEPEGGSDQPTMSPVLVGEL